MNITVRIQRYNPQMDKAPYNQDYSVSVQPEDRVLDALIEIKRNLDGSLAFRRSCAHGVCGSDAMIINGKNRLACKTLIQDVVQAEGELVSIQPLQHLPVERDLMVNQDTFFSNYRSVQPFLLSKAGLSTSQGNFTPAAAPSTTLIPDDAPQTPESLAARGEYIQSPEDRALFDEATKCILCAACYSACPILDKNPNFIGPAAIVQAARFIFDSRDTGLEPRLKVLDNPDGVWPCENHFECTKACPREIKITKLINQTNRLIKKYREERGEVINDGVAQSS